MVVLKRKEPKREVREMTEMDLNNPVFHGYLNDIESAVDQIRLKIETNNGSIYKETIIIRLRANDIEEWLDRLND